MSFLPKRCTYCKEPAGTWEQWPEQSDGMGGCSTCMELLTTTTNKADVMHKHGVEGIHWGNGKRNPFLQDEPLPRADGFVGLTHWEREHARAAIEQHQQRIGIAPAKE